MRPPPLARIAAVAAPSPDAEPVTIAHKPSFDIAVSSPVSYPRSITTSGARIAANFWKTSPRGKPYFAPRNWPRHAACRHVGRDACQGVRFSSSCIAKNKIAPASRMNEPAGRADETRSAVAESENIVVETAEKIFADLA